MAKNIEFMGAIFPDVPSVRLPQQGGGLVAFDDTTDADAQASDIAQGKTAYVNGVKVTGTNQGGGGGGSSWTLMHEEEITVSDITPSSPTSVKNISVDGIWSSDYILVRIRDKSAPQDNHFVETISVIANPNPLTGSTSEFTRFAKYVIAHTTGDNYTTYANAYGVYPLDIQSNGTIRIYCRYDATQSKAIGGTYTVSIYKMTMPDGSSSPFA